MPSTSEDIESEEPCRTCVDFKTWVKARKKATSETPKKNPDCPVDKEELGRNTWSLLHTLAAYYPEKPDRKHKRDMDCFIRSFAQVYPCLSCAEDFQEDIKKHPPSLNSQQQLSKWMCDRHNTVNEKLGKPIFNCDKVHERWKVGWKNGSCDG